MAQDATVFKMSVRSRHPRLNVDYSSTQHRYVSSYLRPNGYDIDLNAFPGFKERTIEVVDHRGGQNKKSSIKVNVLDIPTDIKAYEWSIKKVFKIVQPLGTPTFSAEKINPIQISVHGVKDTPYKQNFHVPTLGEYEITLKLSKLNGTPLERKETITLRDFLVVSIGESAASGEGNPDVPGVKTDCGDFDISHPIQSFENCWDDFLNSFKETFTTFTEFEGGHITFEKNPIWLEEKAHRSLRSGPARAAKALEALNEGTMVTFLSFARSGSTINGGLLGPRTDSKNNNDDPWIGNIGQIDEIKNTIGNRHIDALLISIGGNDLGFSDDIKALLQGDLFHNDDKKRADLKIMIDKRLVSLESNFNELAKKLAELNVGEIYLTEYPTAMFDKMKNGKPTIGGACGVLDSFLLDADLVIDDLRLLRNSAKMLNNLLRKVAKVHKWNYIDGIADEFAGHGYCADQSAEPVDPYFWSAEQSFAIQGDIDGILHPNLTGHRIYQDHISRAVRNSTITPLLKGPVVAPIH